MKADEISECRELAASFIGMRGGGTLIRALGDGGSAVVFLWECAGTSLALKVYSPRFFSSADAPAERYRLDLQRRLIGKNCPSMIDTLAVDEELGTCFVTMEFFDGDELKKIAGKIPDDIVASLIGQLVDAVIFLESFDLVHRDIKPENILVSKDLSILKLLDLGVIRTISDDSGRIDGTDQGMKRPFIATAQYSSPEYLFRLEPPSPALWKALTIYQIGGVLHDLVCKRPLFEKAVAAENKYALAMSVMRELPDFSGASAMVSSWAALASRCLTKDSGLRLQIVDWPDFQERGETGKDKLKRALAVRSANVGRAEQDATQAQILRAARRTSLQTLAESLRGQLIAEFSPQLRVGALGGSESRVCLLLKLSDIELAVKLALEATWQSGILERIATIRIVAQVAAEDDQAEFSGIRFSLGEMGIDEESQNQLLQTLIEIISEILVKYVDMVETGDVANGADLIAVVGLKAV